MPLSSKYKRDIAIGSFRASETDPMDCHTIRSVLNNLEHHADMAVQHHINYCAWPATLGTTYFGPPSSDYAVNGLWSPWIGRIRYTTGDDSKSYGKSVIINTVPIFLHTRSDGSSATLRAKCRFTVDSAPTLDSEKWGFSVFPTSMASDLTLIQSVPYAEAASGSFATVTIPASQLSRYTGTIPTFASSGGNRDVVTVARAIVVFWYQWTLDVSSTALDQEQGIHFTQVHLSEVVGD